VDSRVLGELQSPAGRDQSGPTWRLDRGWAKGRDRSSGRRTGGAFALLLALSLAACGGAPGAPTRSPSPAPTERSTPHPTTTPGALLAAFQARLNDGSATSQQLADALRGAVTAQDSAGLTSDAQALSDWASAERTWLTANAPEPCFAPAARAYSFGVSHLSSAADAVLTLASAGDATAAATKFVIELAAGQGQVQQAGTLLGQSSCGAAVAPSPSGDPVAAFAALAADINARYHALQQQDSAVQALAHDWLALQNEAETKLAALGLPAAAQAALTAYISQADAVCYGLQDATAASSATDAKPYVVQAQFGYLSGLGPAVVALHTALGLPAPAAGDIL
jgi:hypothetical protein